MPGDSIPGAISAAKIQPKVFLLNLMPKPLIGNWSDASFALSGWGSGFSAALLTRSVVKRPLLLWSRGSPCRPLRVISGMGDLVEATLTFIQPVVHGVNYIYIMLGYLSSSTAKRLRETLIILVNENIFRN